MSLPHTNSTPLAILEHPEAGGSGKKRFHELIANPVNRQKIPPVISKIEHTCPAKAFDGGGWQRAPP